MAWLIVISYFAWVNFHSLWNIICTIQFHVFYYTYVLASTGTVECKCSPRSIFNTDDNWLSVLVLDTWIISVAGGEMKKLSWYAFKHLIPSVNTCLHYPCWNCLPFCWHFSFIEFHGLIWKDAFLRKTSSDGQLNCPHLNVLSFLFSVEGNHWKL